MVKFYRSNVIVFFLVLFLTVPFFHVFAQDIKRSSNSNESVGLAINQSLVAFNIDPGKSEEFKITIENISKNEQKISVYSQDFSVEDDNKIEILSNANELNGMKDWIKFDIADLILKPSEKKEITFAINIPEDATVGSHYAGIFFQAFPPINAENFQKTIVSGRVGAYILVNVKGEISGTGRLDKFESPVLASKDEKFTAEFRNTGNIFYVPHGEVRVKNLLTRKEEILNAEKHFVFPGKKYSFDLPWNPSSVFGIYRAQAYFIDGEKEIHASKKFIFGKLFFVWLIIPVFLTLAFKSLKKKKSKI